MIPAFTQIFLDEILISGHEDWLRIIAEVGFEPHWKPFEHSELPHGSTNVYMGVKKGN